MEQRMPEYLSKLEDEEVANEGEDSKSRRVYLEAEIRKALNNVELEALVARMKIAHAAEVERLTGERDSAIARAERAEEALRHLINKSNRVTSVWRHHGVVPPEDIHALYDAQCAAEALESSPPADASKMGGERDHPYGYCPVCGAPGVMRERRPNGDDRCANGHAYPSRMAITAPVSGQRAGYCA